MQKLRKRVSTKPKTNGCLVLLALYVEAGPIREAQLNDIVKRFKRISQHDYGLYYRWNEAYSTVANRLHKLSKQYKVKRVGKGNYRITKAGLGHLHIYYFGGLLPDYVDKLNLEKQPSSVLSAKDIREGREPKIFLDENSFPHYTGRNIKK